MLKLKHGIVELYKKVATSIPPDVEEALKAALDKEADGEGKRILEGVISEISRARKEKGPVCIDTGVPTFVIKAPSSIDRKKMKEIILEATREATKSIPLRPNAVDIITGENSTDNTGRNFPVIYIEESENNLLVVDLLFKGYECEELSRTYRLPDTTIGAERDLDGVRKVVIDAVRKAEGRGCPPYSIGVGIGASRDQVVVLSTKQLFRRCYEKHPDPAISRLEEETLSELNSLGIGPMGKGGRTTAINVSIEYAHRHRDTYLVDVSISCWANRRGKLIWG